MLHPKWRILLAVGCALLLLATVTACSKRAATPTPVQSSLAPTIPAATHVANSPLATPTATPMPTQDDTIIFIRANGDVVSYTLTDRRETVLLAGSSYFDGGERPIWHLSAVLVRVSPDGKWLLIPTLDHGTWLVAMDGTTQRQLASGILSATWAPDSQQIAYTGVISATGNAPQMSVLYTHNIVTGDEPRALLKSEATIEQPIWSPGCDMLPPPAGRSCGQHIFILSILQSADDYARQAAFVEVETGKVIPFGPYVGPPRESSLREFRWSPAGDEFWVPSGTFAGLEAMAYSLDGSTTLPLVSGCENYCWMYWREDEVTTANGWTLRYVPYSYDDAISAQSPTGEQFEVASDAYFVGTLAQLRSTEVDTAQTEIATLTVYSQPGTWNERTIPTLGVSYRLPPEWEESGADSAKWVKSYHFVEPNGLVSLDRDQLTLQIVTKSYGEVNLEQAFQQWLAANNADGNTTLETLPEYIADLYYTQEYDVTGELMFLRTKQAVRLSSEMFPFAEKIVVPIENHTLEISIWPRPSNQDSVLDNVLDSFIFPPTITPTPVAPSPLATP